MSQWLRSALTVLLVSLVFLGQRSAMAQASSLPTTLAGGVVTVGSMFEVKAKTNLQIDSFDLRFALISLGLPSVAEVWALNTPGTYIGNQTSSANWTQIAAVPITGITTAPFALNLNLAFPIPAGQTQAFYITMNNSGLRLEDTPGTSSGTLYASNNDIEFFEGHGGLHFNATMGPQVWNGVIHYTALPTVNDDVSVDSITTSTTGQIDCALGSATEPVTMQITNRGINPVPVGALLTLSYQVGTNTPVVEFVAVTTAMNTGDTLQHTFATTLDLSAPGTRAVVASVLYGIDLDPSNDTINTTFSSGGELHVTSFPFIENFDLMGAPASTTPPFGFINETTDSSGTFSDWLFRADVDATSTSLPSADHTTGVTGSGGFAYVDASGFQSNVGLRTPCFDLSGAINPTARFYMYSINASGTSSSNLLSVDVLSYPGGTVTMDVFGPTGQVGIDWTFHSVDLSAFAGQLVQLRFRVNASLVGTQHDVAIDDFTLTDLVPVNGQGPQPGLAVMDINGSRNANGDLVSFGFGGPYFVDANQGDLLRFSMEGTPLAPILLFTGPFNVAAATFPNIGQMDVGGAVDPVTGIPNNVSVLANGLVPSGLDSFFIVDSAGLFDFGLTVPAFPPGLKVPFQAAINAGGAVGTNLTNMIEVTFN